MTSIYILRDGDGETILVDQNGELVNGDYSIVPAASNGFTAVFRGVQPYPGPLETKVLSLLGTTDPYPDPAAGGTIEERLTRLETAVKALAPKLHPETPGDDYRHRH